MPAQTTNVAQKLLSRAVLITIIVIASLGALASLLYGALAQTVYSHTFTEVELSVVGDESLDVDLPGGAWGQYSTMRVVAGEDVAASENLSRAASFIPYFLAGLLCLALIVLSVRLLRRRGFGLGDGIMMLVLGALAITAGFAVPALRAQAQVVFVESLGLPTNGYDGEVWVSPDYPSWDFSDWPLILMGVLVALGGWLILRARQLRLDLEGTI